MKIVIDVESGIPRRTGLAHGARPSLKEISLRATAIIVGLSILAWPKSAYPEDLNSQLLAASGRGDVATVGKLLAKGANANAADKLGRSPLMLAADRSHCDTVTALLGAGASINAKDDSGLTVLMHAINADYIAEDEYIKTVRALLVAKPELIAKDKKGMTALMYASKGNTSWGVLKMPGGETMITGPPAGRADLEVVYKQVVDMLLARGADVNLKSDFGGTALGAAASSNYSEIAKSLIRAGSDVNGTDGHGQTPLIYAAGEGHTETVNVLIANGASVNVKTSEGLTPLMMASYGGYEETVKALLGAGADVNAKRPDGETALDAARAKGNRNIEALLKQAGAVEHKESAGKEMSETELHYGRAKSILDKGEYDEAIGELTKVIEVAPAMSEAYDLRGFAYLQKKDFEHAISDSTKAIELSPGKPWAFVNRGSAYAGMARYDKAVEDFKSATKLSPPVPQAYAYLGAVYEKTGHGREAADAYEEALKSGLSSPSILNNAAWLYATSSEPGVRNPEIAVQYALKAVEATQGRDPGVLDTMAEAYYASGEFEKAASTIRKAIALDPNRQYYREQLTKFENAGQGKPRQ